MWIFLSRAKEFIGADDSDRRGMEFKFCGVVVILAQLEQMEVIRIAMVLRLLVIDCIGEAANSFAFRLHEERRVVSFSFGIADGEHFQVHGFLLVEVAGKLLKACELH